MKNEAFAPTPELLAKMDAWWRAANYLSACQLYLGQPGRSPVPSPMPTAFSWRMCS